MCKVRQKEVVGATCFKDTCLLQAVQSPAPRGLEGLQTSMPLVQQPEMTNNQIITKIVHQTFFYY
jgi:hypothetical protein